MAEFFKFLFLMIIDVILSGVGAYLVLQRLIKNAGSGTGAIAEGVMAWVIAVISFVVMIVLFGMGLYWLIFMHKLSLWYIVVSLIIVFIGWIIFYARDDILDWLNFIFKKLW